MNCPASYAVALALIATPAFAAEPGPISSGTWELKQDTKGIVVPLVVHDGTQNVVTIYRICQDNGPEMKVRTGQDGSTRVTTLAPGRCLDVVTEREISIARSSNTSSERATGFFHLLFASKK